MENLTKVSLTPLEFFFDDLRGTGTNSYGNSNGRHYFEFVEESGSYQYDHSTKNQQSIADLINSRKSNQ